MKIQLISFSGELNPNYQIKAVIDIINQSDADLILFPGHALRDEDDRKFVEGFLTNKKVTAIVEMEEDGVMGSPNELFIYRKGKFEDMFTSQIFAKAEEVNNNEVLVQKLFDELPRRQFTCKGKRFTVLQCGESAIVSGKGDGEFQCKENLELNDRFDRLLKETDVFLNPIHTIQGRQNHISKRRNVLSSEGRYYFSTACPKKFEQALTLKSLQYICHNGKELTIKPEIHEEEYYVSRTIEI